MKKSSILLLRSFFLIVFLFLISSGTSTYVTQQYAAPAGGGSGTTCPTSNSPSDTDTCTPAGDVCTPPYAGGPPCSNGQSPITCTNPGLHCGGKTAGYLCCLQSISFPGGGGGNICGGCSGTCNQSGVYCEQQIACSGSTPQFAVYLCPSNGGTWQFRYNQTGGSCSGSCPSTGSGGGTGTGTGGSGGNPGVPGSSCYDGTAVCVAKGTCRSGNDLGSQYCSSSNSGSLTCCEPSTSGGACQAISSTTSNLAPGTCADTQTSASSCANGDPTANGCRTGLYCCLNDTINISVNPSNNTPPPTTSGGSLTVSPSTLLPSAACTTDRNISGDWVCNVTLTNTGNTDITFNETNAIGVVSNRQSIADLGTKQIVIKPGSKNAIVDTLSHLNCNLTGDIHYSYYDSTLGATSVNVAWSCPSNTRTFACNGLGGNNYTITDASGKQISTPGAACANWETCNDTLDPATHTYPCLPTHCSTAYVPDGHCEFSSGLSGTCRYGPQAGSTRNATTLGSCGALTNICCPGAPDPNTKYANAKQNLNTQLASRVLGVRTPPKTLSGTITAVNPPLAYSPTTTNVLAVQAYKTTDNLTYDGTKLYVNPAFKLGNIVENTYNMFLHIDKFLDVQLAQLSGSKTFTVPNNALTTQTAQMIPGDIAPLPHGDNIIDIQDYNAMIACMQKDKSCTNPSQADLNWDGVVDQADLDLLISHFGAEGASFEISQFTCVTDPACAKKSTNTIQLCPLKCTKQIPK